MSTEDDRWFTEAQTEGVCLGLRLGREILARKTPYQDLLLAETTELGKLLALDGRIMLTERDEAFYHEMLVHPALLGHINPRRVLVIGGGDGGTLREVLRHKEVEEAVLVEIDREVVQECRRFLGPVHRGSFDDPRAKIVFQPGQEFVSNARSEYDVIIVDSSDPVGPNLPLFGEPFFRDCREALREGGTFVCQCGSPFYYPEELKEVHRDLGSVFGYVEVYLGFVPTYPSGLWSFCLAGDQGVPRVPLREPLFSTKYYTPQVHRAAFALPRFVEELLSQ
ncbi:MAG TPA: polyamine aminopropyltransferase [Candidatus Latescibacteria bacterium]|nr:polyamine aminopropyltransferase [Candidatus Latescibacterota bacterium]